MPASHSSILKNYERIEALPDSAETRKLKRLARAIAAKYGEEGLSAGWTDFLAKAESRDLLVVMPGTIGRAARLSGVKRRARTAKATIALSQAQKTVFGALVDVLRVEDGPPPFIVAGDFLRVYAVGGTRNYLDRIVKGLDGAIEAKSLTKTDANKIRLSITAVLRKIPELPPRPEGRPWAAVTTNGNHPREEVLIGV